MSPNCLQGKISMLCVAIAIPCKLRLIEIFLLCAEGFALNKPYFI